MSISFYLNKPTNRIGFLLFFFVVLYFQTSAYAVGGPGVVDNSKSQEPPYNNPPDKPVLSVPVDGSSNINLIPDLHVNRFYDPDEGDLHVLTEWQISLMPDFSEFVLDRTGNAPLLSTIVPGSLLLPGTSYYWRVRFYDNSQAESEWSDGFSFTTKYNYPVDNNNNGIPDIQDVSVSIDMDQDTISDIYQDDILSLRNKTKSTLIGIKGLTNVSEIESAKLIDDPISAVGFDDRKNAIPFGLISFKLLVKSSDDVAAIKIYFSEQVPYLAKLYVYDPFSGLQDYSAYTSFSYNRKSCIMKLKDNGYGDADGIANGVIVNSGSLIISTRLGNTLENLDNNNMIQLISNVNESLGCFISTSTSGAKYGLDILFLLFCGTGMICVLLYPCLRLRKQQE